MEANLNHLGRIIVLYWKSFFRPRPVRAGLGASIFWARGDGQHVQMVGEQLGSMDTGLGWRRGGMNGTGSDSIDLQHSNKPALGGFGEGHPKLQHLEVGQEGSVCLLFF